MLSRKARKQWMERVSAVVMNSIQIYSMELMELKLFLLFNLTIILLINQSVQTCWSHKLGPSFPVWLVFLYYHPKVWENTEKRSWNVSFYPTQRNSGDIWRIKESTKKKPKNCQLITENHLKYQYFHGITKLQAHKSILPSAASSILLFPANWTLTVFCCSCALTSHSDKTPKRAAQRLNMFRTTGIFWSHTGVYLICQ